MKEKANLIWVEKFRPKTIKDVVLPQSYKSSFQKMVDEKNIPNMLFVSYSPGSGKTSTIKAICNDLDADFFYINASSEGNIDTLRTEIERFAHTKSLSGKQKIVLLDEVDNSTPSFQLALRAEIERFHKYCRFIMTANYITRIKKELLDRVEQFNFDFGEKKYLDELKPKMFKRLLDILKFEKVEYDEKVVEKVVEKNYPSMRRMIMVLQQYSRLYGKIDSNIFSFAALDDVFYNYLLDKDLTNARKYIIENNVNPDDMYRLLFDNFIPRLKKESQSKAILLIAEYQFRNGFGGDKEITMAALLLELIGVV